MSDNGRPGGDRLDWVDPERRTPHNAFDKSHGLSGSGYSLESEQAEGKRHPSGEVDPNRAASSPGQRPGPLADLPPENGVRASFDARTGEVHGSGAGAGGGNPGEDFDSDSQNGDGYPQTGGEGLAKGAHDLGPAHLKE